MPVKIKCTGCQKVLSVPDAARGKVVKCPTCETKLKVPAGTAAAAASKSGVRKPPKQKSAEDFLSDLDLGRMEDTSVRVCPKCGTEATFEDLECPKCGIDFTTGQLSVKAARKKAMRGPDPAEFWSHAWGESWQFLKKNMKLVWRTTFYWTLYLTIAQYCAAAFLWCERIPPKMFWLGLFSMFSLGVPGWYFYLASKIIPSTMAREKKVKDINYDFTLNVGLGIKATAWMFLTTFPLTFIPILISILALTLALFNLPPAVSVLLAAVGIPTPFVCALVALPVALVHMTMRHSWTAWSPWHMAKATAKNIGPAMAWVAMTILTHLPSIGVLATCGILAAMYPEVWLSVLDVPLKIHNWVMESAGIDPEAIGFLGLCLVIVELFVASFVFFLPFCFMNAVPSIYMIRVMGWFGYYFRERLDFVMLVTANEPAGFWPRYVAFMIDNLIIGCFLAIGYGVLFALGLLIVMLEIGFLVIPLMGLFSLLGFLFPYLYYARSESGPGHTTIGKRAVGMIVVDENLLPINFGKASGRYFMRYLLSGTMAGGIGLMMAGFTQKKQALHDMATKTLVVWKGDDETTMR